MEKEIEMVYQMTFLSTEDRERLKNYITTHPHYRRLQEIGVFLSGQK